MGKNVAGIVLAVLGTLALMYGGFHYTTRSSVVDIGPIHASADHDHAVPIAPIAGALLLAAGVAVLVVPRRGT